MKTWLTMLTLCVALAACSSPPQETEVAQTTPGEKAAAIEAAAAAPTLDSAQIDEVKRTLQSEGKTCAQVVQINPREAENKLDVVCIESVGGTQRVTHTIDLGAL